MKFPIHGKNDAFFKFPGRRGVKTGAYPVLADPGRLPDLNDDHDSCPGPYRNSTHYSSIYSLLIKIFIAHQGFITIFEVMSDGITIGFHLLITH